MQRKSKKMENKALEDISSFMSFAARTAPKIKDIDIIVTAVLKNQP